MMGDAANDWSTMSTMQDVQSSSVSPLRSKWVARAAVVLVAALAGGAACYRAEPFRVAVQSPDTALDCVRTVDRVFFDAAYERSGSAVMGPDIFYTPRLGPAPMVSLATPPRVDFPRAEHGLGWGIGVWLKQRKPETESGLCGFELESLSVEPGCRGQCLYSAQRGADFDQTVKDMAARLTAAFADQRSHG
jgi:hypothetical protein